MVENVNVFSLETVIYQLGMIGAKIDNVVSRLDEIKKDGDQLELRVERLEQGHTKVWTLAAVISGIGSFVVLFGKDILFKWLNLH